MISVLIPYLDDETPEAGLREANLQAVLASLPEVQEVWVGVQGQRPVRRPQGRSAGPLVRSFEGGPHLRRAMIVNALAQEAKGEFLWILPPNLWLPPADLTSLDRDSTLVVKPMAAFAKLTADGSRALRETGRLEPAFLLGKTRIGESVGKGSYLVRRGAFLAVRGLDERFVGEADEGFDLLRRLRLAVPGFEDRDGLVNVGGMGAQLFEPRPAGEPERRKENRALRQRLNDVEESVDQQLSTMVSSIPYDHAAPGRLRRRLERSAILRTTRREPVAERPASLPGSIWGLTTFFNPQHYDTKKRNYDLFRAGLRAAGLPLLTVELAFDDGRFELQKGDAERLLQLRCHDVLWHKERLLNVGLEALPAECDKVVWLDCDILFEEPAWVEQTVSLLERFVMVQPFSMTVRLKPEETSVDVSDLPVGNAEHELLHSFGFGWHARGPASIDRYLDHGHSGYAWAGRRAVLRKHGFYDANVLGNADLNMAHAMGGGYESIRSERLSIKAQRHLERWAEAFHAEVRGSIGYVPGLLRHLWHGNKSDRLYDRRLTILVEEDYDPAEDLAIDEQGVYRWATDKPRLHRWCEDYFALRREDIPRAEFPAAGDDIRAPVRDFCDSDGRDRP
ncbi:MAG: hypothetical protein AAGF12_04240 [Myxococcota bacterium]